MDVLSFIFNYVIGFILLISILVFVHEYGHYIFAKWCGVYVESFSIGFGPEIFGWTDKSGTRWKISPIPFGGYVKMKGEMIESSSSDNQDFDPDSFQAKSLLQKFLIVFAGPLFNLIFPIFILLFIGFFAGIPHIQPKIGDVLKDSPSYKILQKGDVIKSINSVKIKDFVDIKIQVSSHPNEVIPFVIVRNGVEKHVKIKIQSQKENNNEVGYLGVAADSTTIFTSKFDISKTISYTFSTYYRVMGLMIEGLGKLFTGHVKSSDIGGPIKIAQMAGDNLSQGFGSWLFFMSMLSLNLAILNLLPIPALDGGHLLLYIIQGVTRKKVNPKIQGWLAQIGFVVLITLMVVVFLKDIFSFL